jgi:hypothetical protein
MVGRLSSILSSLFTFRSKATLVRLETLFRIARARWSFGNIVSYCVRNACAHTCSVTCADPFANADSSAYRVSRNLRNLLPSLNDLQPNDSLRCFCCRSAPTPSVEQQHMIDCRLGSKIDLCPCMSDFDCRRDPSQFFRCDFSQSAIGLGQCVGAPHSSILRLSDALFPSID